MIPLIGRINIIKPIEAESRMVVPRDWGEWGDAAQWV